MRSFSRLSLLMTAVLLMISGAAYASGFAIYEQGAKATAMAGAFVATADDPTAIFYNVAGIAQQRKMEFSIGGTAINFANEFTGDPNDPFTSGTTGAYRRHTFVPPNAYFIAPVGGNLTFGVGVTAPFGLRTNWADPWVGRFSARDSNIKTVDVIPSVAWQTSDGRFAFGVGADYRRARVMLNRNAAAYNPFTQRITDVANAYLSSDWNTDWGYTAGVLFKPSSAWRIGASYRSAMTVDFTGDATFTQIKTGNPQFDAAAAAGIPPTQGVRTALEFPANAALGVAFTGIPTWDIEADVTHTSWSRFQALTVNFLTTPQASFTRVEDWKDTYSYRLGANKKVNDTWQVRLGALYDQNPEPIEAVSPLLPDADRVGITFGVGWTKGNFSVDASEFMLHFKDRGTQGTNTELNGTYKTNANLISLNLGYRF